MATTNAQTFTIGGVTHQVEDTTARAGVSALQTALASLQSALDTLMGTDDITDEIDTYNEIKDFLDGFDVNDPTLSSQLALLNTQVNDLTTAIQNKANTSALNTAVANLQALINGKVDAVNGKGLSTNDYTDTEKAKLAGIDAGAQVNVINGIKKHDGTPIAPDENGIVTLPEQTEVDLSDYYDKDEVDAKVADAGKVKSVTINGTKKTPNETTGDVDLGTIVGQQGPQGEQGPAGPAGPQGNSGVASADGIESVNNLNGGTTDTSSKVYVLGANMGKELGDRLSALEGVETYGQDATLDHFNKRLNGSNCWEDTSDRGQAVSRKILLKAGLEINVHVTGGRAGDCVISVCSNNTEGSYYSGVGTVNYENNKYDYSYKNTSNNDVYVAIGYIGSDGFTATINTGSQMEKNKNSIDAMLERLGGVEIPFRSTIGYYKYANGTLTEVTASSGAENANGHYHTEPITLADYKALFFTGVMNKYNAYFCAVFFDGNGDYVGRGLFHRKGSDTTESVQYTMCNVLDEAPSGAVTVVLQSNNSTLPQKVIGFTDYPYQFIQNKWWRFDSFGIKGDGVTDDADALQQYINSCYGDVQLKKGVYRITKTLYINPAFVRKIVGNGATIVLDGDIYGLRIYGYVGDTADPNISAEKMASTGLIIEDVIITSADGLAWHDNTSGSSVGTGTAIRVQNTFMLTLRGCEIYSVENGVKFEGINRNIIIEGCHIYNCWGNGILFASGVNLHQVNIANNHISYCKYNINFDNPSQIANVQITGNDIETSNLYPTGVTEADKRCIRFVCNNNTSACYEIEIVGNTIQGHGNYADYLLEFVGRSDFAVDTLMSIVGNHISNCARAIGLSYAYDVSISGNTVNNVSAGFIYLAAGIIQRVAVSGNTLNGSDKYLVGTGSTAALSHISVSGNVGNNTPITIDGASQDYISVVGNCLGGGTVTIGDATHKQEANNI